MLITLEHLFYLTTKNVFDKLRCLVNFYVSQEFHVIFNIV
jgi:hypothetical protein